MKRMLILTSLLMTAAPLARGQTIDHRATALRDAAQAVKQLDNELNSAARRNDAAALERIFADEYTCTNAVGAVTTKTQIIANIKSGDLKYESIHNDDVMLRVYGETAVVTGRATVKLTNRGQAVNGQFRFTRVYAKMPGGWQAVAAQSTRIEPPPTQ